MRVSRNEAGGGRARPSADDFPAKVAAAPPFVVGVIDGEGIGPELAGAALRVLEAVAAGEPGRFEVRRFSAAPPRPTAALDPAVLAFCRETFAAGGAILAGPVGGRFVYELRRAFDLFCKLVPVRPFREPLGARRIRDRFLAGVDLVIVRENVSGLYFGECAERDDGAAGRRVECSFTYGEREVRRVVDVAARIAAARRGHMTVVAKDGGAPELTRLWRSAAAAAAEQAGIRWDLQNADLATYRLIQHPADFDVLVAPNLIGDVLADVSAVLLGSRGLGYSGNFAESGAAVYQTNHGGAADLVGSDRANPVAQIMALAMLLSESFGLTGEAERIERAVADVWRAGWRTADLAEEGCRVIGTAAMAERIAAAVRAGRPAAGVPAGEASRSWAHVSPRDLAETRFVVPLADRAQVEAAARAARDAGRAWRASVPARRVELLDAVAARLSAARAELVDRLARDVGKPVAHGEAEVTRAIDLLRAAAAAAAEDPGAIRRARDGGYRYVPVGVIGMLTPWNHSLAIPVGKIAPALAYGNGMVWKPAPAGTGVAHVLMRCLMEAGAPPALVSLVTGDAETARAVMEEARVDAVTLAGPPAVGRAAVTICARRRVPLQAELGGNNAAVVWDDSDVAGAARRIAAAAFGFAGQRCTANRRAIVAGPCFDRFLSELTAAAGALAWGDPLDPATEVGPVVSAARRDEILALLERAGAAGEVLRVHEAPRAAAAGAYVAPAVVVCADPAHEVVQDETFGPVLVVQRAAGWEHALELLNGVRQGLVAALFSASEARRGAFLDAAEAGVLKFDRATAGAGVDVPFGGWKESGVGRPEHGPANREFYARAQAVVRDVDG